MACLNHIHAAFWSESLYWPHYPRVQLDTCIPNFSLDVVYIMFCETLLPTIVHFTVRVFNDIVPTRVVWMRAWIQQVSWEYVWTTCKFISTQCFGVFVRTLLLERILWSLKLCNSLRFFVCLCRSNDDVQIFKPYILVHVFLCGNLMQSVFLLNFLCGLSTHSNPHSLSPLGFLNPVRKRKVTTARIGNICFSDIIATLCL